MLNESSWFGNKPTQVELILELLKVAIESLHDMEMLHMIELSFPIKAFLERVVWLVEKGQLPSSVLPVEPEDDIVQLIPPDRRRLNDGQ